MNPVYILLGLALGALVMLTVRYRKQRGEADRLAKQVYDLECQIEANRDNVQYETGFNDASALTIAWKRLIHDLGYALHHIEEFEASSELKAQLGHMGSCLRMRAHSLHRRLQPVELGLGGFQAVGVSERDIQVLVHGLTTEQIALICCKILDGYYLEGAFSELGITVLSPAGKATVLGQLPINVSGAKVQTKDFRALLPST